MSYNGSGTFQINTSGQPVVAGTVISSTAFNALTADLATGLSTAITKDGQTTTTARIPFAQGISSTLTTDSSSVSTGSIITAGGIGAAKAAYIGTTLNVGGASTFTGAIAVDSVTDSSSTTTGSIQTDGGLGVAKAVYVGTTLNVAGATTAASGSFTSLTDSGNLTFTGTGNRITGDFSNATLANRVAFQTSTTNTATTITILPNGTATVGQAQLYSNSDPTNSSRFTVAALSTEATIRSDISGTGTYLPMTLHTGGSERVRVDTSGNVGIGTSSPSSVLNVKSSAPVFRLETTGDVTSSGTASYAIKDSSGNDVFANGFLGLANCYQFSTTFANGFIRFLTGSQVEAMRIDSSGNLLVGTTSVVSVGAGAHILSLRASSTSWGVGPTSTFANFYVKSATSTGVALTTSATAWSSDSDERKKTTITPFENAINKICSLRAGTGRYLTDEESMSRSFLIAQDVQSVLPEAVDVGEDVDQSLMLRYTDVIPLLVAAIKEQQALITALTARITALENK